MKKLLSFAALLGSLSTLVCCFLPALFVVLGFGASFAGLVGAFPQLTWLSEHKGIVFGSGGALIVLSAWLHARSAATACPIDPRLAAHCRSTKSWSRGLLFAAASVYALGAFFAFLLPRLL